MRRLLVVHHTASPALHSMHEAVIDGATNPEIGNLEVVSKAALSATAPDVLAADAYLIGTPANLGYMSGALKHFFDTVYYPCLAETSGRPYGAYVHGNDDTAGAISAIEKVTTGLAWTRVHLAVSVVGPPSAADLEACWELGATVAARLTTGLS